MTYDEFLEQQRQKCERKREYRTRHIAKARAQHIGSRYGQKMEAYKCRYCKAYHITRVKTKEKR